MAEILGILCSMAQAVDLANKALSAISKLYRDVRDAPQKIKDIEISIKHITIIVVKLEGYLSDEAHVTPSAIAPISNLEGLASILLDLRHQIEELNAILTKISPRQGENVWRRTRRVVSGLEKEKEIGDRTQRLERLQISLTLWYHHNLAISSQQHFVALADIGMKVDEITLLINQQYQTPIRYSLGKISIDDGTSYHELDRYTDTIRHSAECTCSFSRRPSARNYIFGPVQYFNKQRQHHGEGCPLFHSTNSLHTWGARLRLPWFASYRLKAEIVQTRSTFSFSIMPMISIVRIVDETTSVAFMALRDASREIGLLGEKSLSSDYSSPDFPTDQDTLLRVNNVLGQLYRTLRLAFTHGKASGKDELKSGRTLLHELVLMTIRIRPLPETVFVFLKSITDLLVLHGVDTNSRAFEPGRSSESQTALEFNLESCRVTPFWDPAAPSLDRLLSSYGCEAAPAVLNSEFSSWAIELLPRNIDLALDMECSSLSFAIINRDISRVREHIRNGYHASYDEETPFSPLCYAISWPEALEALLDAGADPSSAIHCAIACGNKPIVEVLLERGSRLFVGAEHVPGHWYHFNGDSVLAYAISNAISQSLLPVLIDRVALSRKLLKELVIKSLPEHMLKRANLNGFYHSDSLLDAFAPAITFHLRRQRIEFPAWLGAGKRASVYHGDAMNLLVAEKLYSVGFHDVDREDLWHATPLFLLCLNSLAMHFEFADLVHWYIRHGALVRGFVGTGGYHHLHAVAYSFDSSLFLGAFRDNWDRKNVEAISHISTMTGQPPRDICSCFCSPLGCMPSTVLIREHAAHFQAYQTQQIWSNPWQKRLQLLENWVKRTAASEHVMEIYANAARVEIFDRLGMAHTCCRCQK
ncbi:hypothetical protein NA57DRAFT_59827 [Rhizodiscina lignyota]|uniref:Fungal N-terminal domain-containing protein n=1 Tax=Rhizodiscina lignyota TaxID=1504668 RepID=A0A9P4I4P6_9PEZI|nr:hypothetical protein NA57DRAFT_59827 [Rhizodiscina lignyota]